MRRFRLFLADGGGASAVEFALVALPFFLMVFGIIEVGRALWTRQALSEVAMNGARCAGVVHPACSVNGEFSVAATRDHVVQQGRGWGLTLEPETVSVAPDTSCNGVDGFVEITVAHTFTTPLPAGLLRVVGADGLFTVSACFPNQG